MFLGIDMGFWIGIGAVAGITLIGCAAAWVLPPKQIDKE